MQFRLFPYYSDFTSVRCFANNYTLYFSRNMFARLFLTKQGVDVARYFGPISQHCKITTNPKQDDIEKTVQQIDAKEVSSTTFARNKKRVKEYEIELIKKVQQHEHDFSSTEAKIAKLTAELRNKLRQAYTSKKTLYRMRTVINHNYVKRWHLLNKLRNFRFETYCKTLKELKIKHVLPPEVEVRHTVLADKLEDMRIRAKHESIEKLMRKKKIMDEFTETKKRIKQQLTEEQRSCTDKNMSTSQTS